MEDAFIIFTVGLISVVSIIIVLYILYKLYVHDKEAFLKLLSYSMVLFLVVAFSIVYFVLGVRISNRNQQGTNQGTSQVKALWGGEINQESPLATVIEYKAKNKKGKSKVKYYRIKLNKSDINIRLKKNIRTKGLLTYSGYIAYFKGKYNFTNPFTKPKLIQFNFPLPKNTHSLDQFNVLMGKKTYEKAQDISDGFNWKEIVNPKQTIEITINYRAKGLNSWLYKLKKDVIKKISSFSMRLETDYINLDYMPGSMTATTKEETDNNSIITWVKNELITTQNIGIKLPQEPNPWVKISSIFFYAPLFLFLFIAALLIYSRGKDIALHVVNFFFIATGFSSFYFLLSYIVTYLDFISGFFISFGVSASLVIYYVFILKKGTKLVLATIFFIVVFQLIFSLAFFFPEHTGFIIVIASILSLFALMKFTIEIDWQKKF